MNVAIGPHKDEMDEAFQAKMQREESHRTDNKDAVCLHHCQLHQEYAKHVSHSGQDQNIPIVYNYNVLCVIAHITFDPLFLFLRSFKCELSTVQLD